MPQSDKQTLVEIRDLQLTISQKQERFEEEIARLNEKIDKLLRFIDPSSGEENESENAATLVEYFEQQYGHLKEMGKSYIQDESYRLRRTKLRMWKNLLNKRKIAYYNAVKSKGMADVYKGFFQRDELCIPKKFREKTTHQDTEIQLKIKEDLSAAKFNAQIQILEDKIVHYTTMYLEIDEELRLEIINHCPLETHDFLENFWLQNTKAEEEKSKKIWQKKETWLRNMPQQEKENERKREIEKKKKNDRRQNEVGRLNNIQHSKRNGRNEDSGITRENPSTYPSRERNVRQHNYRQARHRTDNSQNISYADAVAHRYKDDIPRPNRNGSYNDGGQTKKGRAFDNRYESTIYIGQKFRNRPIRRENRSDSIYRNQCFLEEETGLKLPP